MSKHLSHEHLIKLLIQTQRFGLALFNSDGHKLGLVFISCFCVRLVYYYAMLTLMYVVV